MAGNHSTRRRRGSAERFRVLAAVLAVLIAGCATRVTQTKRSGTEQELLVQSLERALAHLDLSRFSGKRVVLNLYALTPDDQGFASEFAASRLEAKGVVVVPDAAKADLRLKIFARVLAVDQGQSFVGVPALVVPVLGYPIPEIALFKWVRNRGHSEVEIYSYDPHTDRFIDATPIGVGRTKYDEFTVLLFIGFTVEDLAKPPEPSGQ
jgi:hypothetical protein